MLNKIQNNRDKISGHTHPVFRVERILMVGVFLRFLRNRIATSARTAPRRFINRCTQERRCRHPEVVFREAMDGSIEGFLPQKGKKNDSV
jgi:hypothetical protein